MEQLVHGVPVHTYLLETTDIMLVHARVHECEQHLKGDMSALLFAEVLYLQCGCLGNM